jgi:ADP-ribosylglycohydrolase
MSVRFEDRVLGCFLGLATGDAIGKQTETLTRGDVEKWYPGGIPGFHGRPGEVIPRYAGKRYEWRIGETTDDTEQTIAIARALIHDPRARHEAFGRELLTCRKSAHPGVSLWNFLRAGDPGRIAPDGDGCGAAMRVAPVGVVYPTSRMDELVRAAYESAIPTHGGPRAMSGAAAVAGAVSAAVEGRSVEDVRTMAQEAGAGPLPDIVSAAIDLALTTRSAEKSAFIAANLGGDADTVASIAGAIAGAIGPETVNREWVELVRAINGDDLFEAARALCNSALQWRGRGRHP